MSYGRRGIPRRPLVSASGKQRVRERGFAAACSVVNRTRARVVPRSTSTARGNQSPPVGEPQPRSRTSSITPPSSRDEPHRLERLLVHVRQRPRVLRAAADDVRDPPVEAAERHLATATPRRDGGGVARPRRPTPGPRGARRWTGRAPPRPGPRRAGPRRVRRGRRRTADPPRGSRRRELEPAAARDLHEEARRHGELAARLEAERRRQAPGDGRVRLKASRHLERRERERGAPLRHAAEDRPSGQDVGDGGERGGERDAAAASVRLVDR